MSAAARGLLTVDLAGIKANWRWLAAVARGAECAGVVKADAYGLGIEPVAKALWEAGCRTFFVATLSEGRRLKVALPAATAYVLDGLLPATAPLYPSYGLRPVLGSRSEIEEWAAYARSVGARLPAAVHIDTGMNRLGMTVEDVEAVAADPAPFEAFPVTLIMSHLACGDTPGSPMNARQKALFDALRAKLPAAPASLSNSAGTLLGADYRYDLVRAGIALYGGRAIEGRPNPAAKVVRVEARILQVRQAEAGSTVGYGAAYTLTRPSRLATIATGYADGFLRSISGPIGRPSPPAYVAGYPAPIVGRVSMDVVTVDVTDIPAALAQRGAWAELIGRHVGIDDLADSSGTIGYEVLTRLGPRFQRVYLHGS
ncbi:MAG: alanine racemase [Hyphomicrobium sp. SCN 65-11]|nr:MAG: alanine racemase [Hyphomicrobium sp. SCN 65-11]